MNKLAIISVFLLTLFPVFSESKTVTVTGTGSVSVEPDTVSIRAGVETASAEIKEAVEENKNIMGAVFTALAELGIDNKDIQTSNYNVYLYKPYNKSKEEADEYRVSNMITVNIKDMTTIDKVLDALIKMGANKINGIDFTVSNVDKHMNNARLLAMKNARAKAELYAAAEGMKITGVMHIAEGTPSVPVSPMKKSMAFEAEASVVAPGQETVKSTITVVYIMESE